MAIVPYNPDFLIFINTIVRLLGLQGRDDLCDCEHLLPLEHADGVRIQVTHVQALAFGLDIGMFPDQQPATMCKEETTLGIVGICLCLGVLVMDTVITGPFDDVILHKG